LIVDRRQVLKRAERDRCQTKQISEIEISHVTLNERHTRSYFLTFGLKILPTALEHVPREVKARDLDPCTGGGYQHTACTAADLKHRSAVSPRLVDEEIDIGTLAVGCNMIVELCNEIVIMITAAFVHYGSNSRIKVRS
jgi:hypothetical protein